MLLLQPWLHKRVRKRIITAITVHLAPKSSVGSTIRLLEFGYYNCETKASLPCKSERKQGSPSVHSVDLQYQGHGGLARLDLVVRINYLGISLTVSSKNLPANIKFESLIMNLKFAGGTSKSVSILFEKRSVSGVFASTVLPRRNGLNRVTVNVE
jgi:hypothetical protein